MLLLVELPFDYPNTVPHMRLKNLSPDYLDNRMLDDYEVKLRAANHENIGNPMIFETCELLREEIAEINDSVLDKFNGIIRAKQEQAAIDAAPKLTDTNFLDYTPVNAETFGKWCKEFLSELK